MTVKIRVRRLGTGWYSIDTPSGTYELKSHQYAKGECPGIGTKVRWLLTYPGREAWGPDDQFWTKRDAVENIRGNEQWKADHQ